MQVELRVFTAKGERLDANDMPSDKPDLALACVFMSERLAKHIREEYPNAERAILQFTELDK